MDYDVCIIGAGWAGFNAALHAVKLGKKVCLVEANLLGGTCLNSGCIPTKALVHFSKEGLVFNEIQAKKAEIVQRLKTGMEFLLKKNNIDFVKAKAVIEGPGRVSLDTGKQISAKFILVATGSEPRDLPQLKIDHAHVVSSDDVLNWQELPKKLLIVGGGVIGCEFASIFKRLGVSVTVAEIAEQLLPGMDLDVSKKLKTAFEKSGIEVLLKVDLSSVKTGDYDKILLAVGRKPVFEGVLSVDRALKTNIKNVFAAGDCVGGYMLAHVASYEGELAISNMFSRVEMRDYLAVPASVFTSPEVACIGISEQEAEKIGCNYKAQTVHFLSVGMAHIFGETNGFVKVIIDADRGFILGVSIIGPQASELINSFSIIIKNKISIKELRKTIFAHPSISEIIAELAKSF